MNDLTRCQDLVQKVPSLEGSVRRMAVDFHVLLPQNRDEGVRKYDVDVVPEIDMCNYFKLFVKKSKLKINLQIYQLLMRVKPCGLS